MFGVIISFVLIFIFLTQTTSETPISVDLEELSTKILPTNKLSSTPTSNISIDKPPVQVEGQPPIESCHWFNKILKVIIREQFNSPSFRSFYQAKIEKKIHKIQKPDFIVPFFFIYQLFLD